jgi:PAS domain-containing protein
VGGVLQTSTEEFDAQFSIKVHGVMHVTDAAHPCLVDADDPAVVIVNGVEQAFEVAHRMAAMVEFSGAAIVGGTLEGIITSWNPAAERIFAYSSQEMIGKSVSLVLPRDRTSEAIPTLAKITPPGGLEPKCRYGGSVSRAVDNAGQDDELLEPGSDLRMGTLTDGCAGSTTRSWTSIQGSRP